MGSALLCLYRRTDGTIVLELSGELDLEGEAGLKSLLVDTITGIRPPSIVVDMARVTSIDTAGIATLMDGYRAAIKHRVGFLVRDVSPAVAGVLTASGVYRLFTGGA
jgi:anti-anti-sigma factor